jgi:hypothetical protein
MEYGFFVEPGLVFSYTPKDYFSLSLSVSYRDIIGTRGDTEIKVKDNTVGTSENQAGAGYHTFDVRLIATFNAGKSSG